MVSKTQKYIEQAFIWYPGILLMSNRKSPVDNSNKEFWLRFCTAFWVKVVFAMHAPCMHASHIHATVDFEIWHFRAISRAEDLLFFLKTKAFAHCSTGIPVFTPWFIMPVAAFSVNHVCPFKYRTYSSVPRNFVHHCSFRGCYWSHRTKGYN